MYSSLIPSILIAAAAVAASPARVPAWTETRAVESPREVSIRDSDVALEKRMSAEFELERQWDNELLFGASQAELGIFDDDISYTESVGLSVTCVECWTKGLVTAKLTTEDIFKPVVRLAFAGVEAYLDLAVAARAGATYAITLFATESPLGLSLPDLDLGLVFSLDLVFSVSATIDLEGGFYVKLADDAYLDTDLFTGDIADSFFDGIQTQSIPVTVHSGSAIFKADLRLRVQCGASAELDLLGIGAGAEIGIYANLLEFAAELDSTASCGLETREWFDVNVGAFARLDVEVDYKKFGAVPSISTTLFDSPTFTQCGLGSVPAETISASASASVSGTAVYVSVPNMSGSYSASIGGGSGATTVATSTVWTPSVSDYSDYTALPSPTYTPSSGHSLPLGNSSTTASGNNLVTSTIYSTTAYTVTSCAASVVNCPASLGSEIVVTRTINAYTTVCPFGASITAPAPTKTASSQGSSVTAVHVVTTQLITIPKVSPKVQTFIPGTTAQAQSSQQTQGQQQTTTVTVTSPAAAITPTAGAVPIVNNNKAVQPISSYVAENCTTATLAQSAASYGTSVGMPSASVSATMPVQGAGNSLEASRLSSMALACAALVAVAGLM